MKKIKWYIHTGYVGADYNGEWEFEDDEEPTVDELQEMMDIEVWDRIEAYWEK